MAKAFFAGFRRPDSVPACWLRVGVAAGKPKMVGPVRGRGAISGHGERARHGGQHCRFLPWSRPVEKCPALQENVSHAHAKTDILSRLATYWSLPSKRNALPASLYHPATVARQAVVVSCLPPLGTEQTSEIAAFPSTEKIKGRAGTREIRPVRKGVLQRPGWTSK